MQAKPSLRVATAISSLAAISTASDTKSELYSHIKYKSSSLGKKYKTNDKLQILKQTNKRPTKSFRLVILSSMVASSQRFSHNSNFSQHQIPLSYRLVITFGSSFLFQQYKPEKRTYGIVNTESKGCAYSASINAKQSGLVEDTIECREGLNLLILI